jgi:hypothetical protein
MVGHNVIRSSIIRLCRRDTTLCPLVFENLLLARTMLVGVPRHVFKVVRE